MSDRIRTFMDKPLKKKTNIIEENIIKIVNILNESVNVLPSDKENLYKFINEPNNISFVLNTYSDTYNTNDRTVEIVRKSGKMVLVSIFYELQEIIDIIIEMCDEMGWVFKETINGEYAIFTIQVTQ
jgi:hypothetical protein